MEAAAQTYFSTSADRLTLPQAALLAGMIRAPEAYDPFRHPRAAAKRRATVLARLERHGHLGPAARGRAAAAPLGLRPGGPAGDRAARAPWFVGWVLDQLLDPADHRFDALGTSRRARTARVFTGGLRIATTVDLPAQAAAERSVASVAGRRGRGPLRGPGRAGAGDRGGQGDGRRAQLVGRPPLRPGQPGHRGRRRRPARRVRVQALRPGRGPGAGHPARGGVRRPGPAGGGPPRPGAGLAGGQLRGPRLRARHPAPRWST